MHGILLSHSKIKRAQQSVSTYLVVRRFRVPRVHLARPGLVYWFYAFSSFQWDKPTGCAQRLKG